MIVDFDHCTREDHRQRITTKQWREVLLSYHDHVVFQGKMRKLLAKNLGAGVVEIYKEPLKETT